MLKSLSFLKLYTLDVTLDGSNLRSLCSSSFKIEPKSLLHRSHLRAYKVCNPNVSKAS